MKIHKRDPHIELDDVHVIDWPDWKQEIYIDKWNKLETPKTFTDKIKNLFKKII